MDDSLPSMPTRIRAGPSGPSSNIASATRPILPGGPPGVSLAPQAGVLQRHRAPSGRLDGGRFRRDGAAVPGHAVVALRAVAVGGKADLHGARREAGDAVVA